MFFLINPLFYALFAFDFILFYHIFSQVLGVS